MREGKASEMVQFIKPWTEEGVSLEYTSSYVILTHSTNAERIIRISLFSFDCNSQCFAKISNKWRKASERFRFIKSLSKTGVWL